MTVDSAQQATVHKPRELTQRELLFCFKYVENGGNGTQAAISAGYSIRSAATNACLVLKKLHIQEKIKDLRDSLAIRLERKLEISTQSVVNDLVELKEHCLARKPVKLTRTIKKKVVDENGEEQVERIEQEYEKKIFDPASANRSLELLGRHVGGFNEKHDLRVTHDPVTVLLEEIDGSSTTLVPGK